MKNRTPEEVLELAAIFGSSAAIQYQEKRGQDDLNQYDVLPKDCPRTDLEKLGFVFREDVDDLFVSVTMPSGWSKEPTSHSMWTDLLDEKGRKRGSMFYKAAFYDRSAFLRLNRRFYIATVPINGYGEEYNRNDPDVVVVTDCERRVWQSEPLPPLTVYSIEEYKAREAIEAEHTIEATHWLSMQYPQWEDVTAHWE